MLTPLVAFAAIACSREDEQASTGPTTSRVASESSPASPAPPGCAGLAPAGSYGVGRTTVTLVDPSRPTPADAARGLDAKPDRTLAVSVLYPAEGSPEAPGTFSDGARPAGGEWPLVVYSHGLDSSGTERNDDLARWAAAGYVVAAPTFPISHGPQGNVADLPSQPEDVMFVVSTLPATLRDARVNSGISVSSDCLALAGHSLGGLTTVAASFDPCCEPRGLKAAVVIAGGLYGPTQGADWSAAPLTPLLVVHGRDDKMMPVEKGREVAATLPGPHWLVELPSAGHSTMFEPPLDDVADPTIVAFLDANLRGDEAAFDTRLGELRSGTDAIVESGP